MTLVEQTAAELLSNLKDGNVSAVEAATAFLERIETDDDRLGAFLSVNRDDVLQQAETIDQRRTAGQDVGPLGGLPVAVKDVFCTRGRTTTCGSRMLEKFIPPYDATVVSKLREAGAVLIGKTNMDEFAMGSSNENSAFRPVRNPWNENCVPGGSSGGSAAAVAAGMTPLSVGTDTGGSIRQPAAFCGVTGMKPTYGRVSRYGLIAFASSLDQAGPFARTAEDAALLLEAIAGHDPRDSTSADAPVPAYSQMVREPLKNLRIGIAREHFGDGLDAEVEAAVREAARVYESQGATLHDVSLPHSQYGVAVYYIVAASEASSNLARYDGHYGYRTNEQEMREELAAEAKALIAAGKREAAEDLDGPLVRMYRRTRAEAFGAEVKRRIMLGTYTLSAGYYDAYYLKALKVRRLIAGDYEAAFGDVDLLLGPSTPTPAYKLGEKLDDPLAMYLGDIYTVTANLAGVPGISVPCGFSSEGLPLGMQLQGPPLSEDRLLRAAHMYQQATDWHRKTP